MSTMITPTTEADPLSLGPAQFSSPGGWHQWSIAGLTSRLRSREVGAVEIAKAVLTRIEKIEPEVGAFVHVDDESFLDAARAAQRRLDKDGDGAPALTGVPIVIKDLIDVRGMRTTAASRVLAENTATRDAPVVRRLRMAGVTVIGKANTHEFAYGGACEPTRNPWDTSRMAGGSSGGNAAALAAGLCFGGIGSDTAGSVRIPAGLCGVTGLKPSRGAVSTRGVVPLAPSLDCVGPLGRSPQDVAALYAAMLAPAAATRVIQETRAGSVQGLRVGVVTETGPTADPVLAARDTAAEVLTAHGATVTPLAPAVLDHRLAADVNFEIMAVESARVHRQWLREHADKYSPYVRERLEDGLRVSAVDYLDTLDKAARIRAAWDKVLGAFDIVLPAGMPVTAPKAYVSRVEVGGSQTDRDWLLCRDAAFANITGHPALAVPAGIAGGLPVGVQLVASRGRDATLFPPANVVYNSLAEPIP